MDDGGFSMIPTPKTDKMLVNMRNGKPATFFRRTIVYSDDCRRLERELTQTRAVNESNADLLTFAKWALHQFQGDSGMGESYWEQFPEYLAGKEAIRKSRLSSEQRGPDSAQGVAGGKA